MTRSEADGGWSRAPEETAALLVCVDRYEDGIASIPGIARQVAKLAEALIERGVPARNLLVLRDQAMPLPAGIQYFGRADRDGLRKALDALRVLDTRLLWLHCFGHGGYTNLDSQLLWANARRDDAIALPLTALRKLLREDRSIAAIRQVLTIDACQEDHPALKAHAPPTAAKLGRHEVVEQVLIYSARPGYSAEYRPEDGGVFTTALIDEIREAHQWPPDIRSLGDSLAGRLEELLGEASDRLLIEHTPWRGERELAHHQESPDLVVHYLGGVVRSACRWPVGWEPYNKLPDPDSGRQELSVYRLDLDAGAAEEQGPASSWSEASKSHRLIVLFGDAGQGKTWTLQNEARVMAASALAELGTGAVVTSLELPLYVRAADLTGHADTPGQLEALAAHSVAWALGDTDHNLERVVQALADFVAAGGRVRWLIDALDEVPRTHMTSCWTVVRSCVRDRRAVLASRRNGFPLGLSQFSPQQDAAFVLGPMTTAQVVHMVQRWFSNRPDEARQLLQKLEGPTMAQVVRVPLFLAMVCLLQDTPTRLPTTSTGILSAVSRRIVATTWKFDQHLAVTESVDDALEIAARLAWYLAAHKSGWRDQVPLEEALQTIHKICRDNPGLGTPPRTGPWRPWAREYLVSTIAGLISIARDPDPTEPGTLRFTHRAIHEFLTALYMTRYAEGAAISRLSDWWWIDAEWTNSIRHAVALSSAPDDWVRAIAADTPNTLFTNTTMALSCLASLSPERRGEEGRRIEDVARLQLEQVRDLAPYSHTRDELEEALGDPSLNRGSPVLTNEFLRYLDDVDVETLLDEIDDVLEEDAEEFVRGYVFPKPYHRVSIGREERDANHLRAFVRQEWLRHQTYEEYGHCGAAPSDVGVAPEQSEVETGSLEHLVTRLRCPSSDHSGWEMSVIKALVDGAVPVTIPVLAGLLLSTKHEHSDFAAYMLSTETLDLSDRLLDEFRIALGHWAVLAAAAALAFCGKNSELVLVRRLLVASGEEAHARAIQSVKFALHLDLVNSLEPLVLEDVPDLRAAVAYYLSNGTRGQVSRAQQLALATDLEPDVRRVGLRLLVETAEAGDLDTVSSLLFAESDEQVLQDAIWALQELAHPWAEDLIVRGYRSRRPCRDGWAAAAVWRAQANSQLLPEIAADQTVHLSVRFDAIRSMWQSGRRTDVVEMVKKVPFAWEGARLDTWYYRRWGDDIAQVGTDSAVELLVALFENVRPPGRPLTHPLWLVADRLRPQLAVHLKDRDLRRRFRIALYRFEGGASDLIVRPEEPGARS